MATILETLNAKSKLEQKTICSEFMTALEKCVSNPELKSNVKFSPFPLTDSYDLKKCVKTKNDNHYIKIGGSKIDVFFVPDTDYMARIKWTQYPNEITSSCQRFIELKKNKQSSGYSFYVSMKTT